MDVKNRIYFIILISLVLICLLGCSKSQNLYNKMETVKSKETSLNTDNENSVKDEDTVTKDAIKKETIKKDTVKKDSNKKKTVKKNSAKKETVNKDKVKNTITKDTSDSNDKVISQSKDYFSPEDIYINKKPVLNISYEQLLQDFGKPLKQEIYEVRLPASEEIEYLNVCVYKGFECEFLPNEKPKDVLLTDSVFRFDITSESAKLDCGLQIGMTIAEIEELFGKRNVYQLDSSEEDGDFNNIKAVLEGYKPNDYYTRYNDAMIIYHDTEKFEDPLAKALVLLINHGRLDRIVFNYPTAG